MPASICETCQNKTCLKSGKPCKEVEKLMRAEGIYSADYIRPQMPSGKKNVWGNWREIPTSNLNTKGRKEIKISKKWGSLE
jgi:hypothetical protein